MKYLKTYEALNWITFKEWLFKHTEININSTSINCRNYNLIDLNGIEEFTNLKYLYCHDNQLKSLPDLSNLTSLEYLSCSNNQLTSLPDLSNLTNLKYLSCYDNQLTSLPDLSNLTNLNRLDCYSNKLPYRNLEEYLQWHKKTYPWIWNAKKFKL